MGDREAAPVLRARFLRSYVPLRLRSERKCVLRHHTRLPRRLLSITQIRIVNYYENVKKVLIFYQIFIIIYYVLKEENLRGLTDVSFYEIMLKNKI